MSINTTESKKADPRSSPNPDSEYDTASDSHSEEEEEDDVDVDDEDDDLDDDEDDEIQEIENSDNDEDDGSIVLDLERSRGDGQETDAENKKKVDDDEDRSNPQYIPKKGTFYEHDDRTADDGSKPEPKTGEEVVEKEESPTPSTTKPMKKWQSSTGAERWSHDRFDAGEQAPKSRSELVSAYGYDIRNEDGPPRARRRRRYGRGPSKYTRKWEDENAYGKTTPQQQQQQQQRKPRPEDFPALGTRSSGRRNPDESFKENNSDEINKRPQNRNYQDGRGSPGRRSQPRDNHHQHHHHQNQHNRDTRKDRGTNSYKTGRNTVEYKNQNRNKMMGSPSLQYSGNNSNTNNSRTVNNIVDNKGQFDDVPMESMSFTNTKLYNNNNNHSSNSNNNNNNNNNTNINNRSNTERFTNENDSTIIIEQQQLQRYNRNSRERDRPSNLSGRTQVPQRNPINTNKPQQNIQQPPQQQQQHQQQPTPPQQQQQQLPQQPPQIPPNSTTHISNVTQIVESSRTKRYSSLRQKSTTDSLPQQQPPPPPQQQQLLQQQQHPQQSQQQQQPISKQQNLQITVVHDQLLLQQQQQKEKTNLIQNNLIQDNLNYPSQKTQQQQIVVTTNQAGGNFQQIPIHLQNELLQTNAIQQQQQTTNQTIITTVPSSQQTTVVAQQPQYPPGTYYATGSGPEFNPQQVAQQNPQPQPAQMISTAQYPAQFTQQSAGTSYIQAPPGAYLPQQPSHPQPQIINYVPTIPATQTQYPAQFAGYQNYTAVPPTNQASAIYQTQSGLTFYAPQTQTQPRPVLAQRRPTNAIPILAPPERFSGKGRGRLINQFEDYDEQETKVANTSEAALGSAENIDHILDNMFVQRTPYQHPPPQQVTVANMENPITSGNLSDDIVNNKFESVQQISSPINEINDIEKSVKELTIKEEIVQNPVKETIIENSLSSCVNVTTEIPTTPVSILEATSTLPTVSDDLTINATHSNITEQPA